MLEATGLGRSYRGVVAAALLAVLFLTSTSAQAARPESDALDAASLDTCRWFEWSQAGRIAHDGALLLQTDGARPYGNALVTTQYTVRDVVAEVDVALRGGFDAPAGNPALQLYAGLGLYVDGGNYLIVALARTPEGVVVRTVRVAQGDGDRYSENPPAVPLPTTATRLRIERRGGRATLSFRDAGHWRTAAVFDGFAAPAVVTLQTTNIGVARSLTAAFSGFTLGDDSASSYRSYVPGDRFARADVKAGGVVTDYLYQRDWAGQWRAADPLRRLASGGMGWVRTGVTTLSSPELRSTPQPQWGTLAFRPEFWSSLEATGQVLLEAQALGMGKVLFFYLNDSAAHAGRQEGPAAWRGLALDDLAQRVREHTAGVAAHYRSRGIRIELYEIGNETLLGLLGVSFSDRVAVPAGGVDVLRDVPVLRRWLWRDHARLLKAAIEGVRSVDPQARIGLHAEGIALSPADLLVKAYFRSMVEEGVPFDTAGLSLPYPSYPWTLDRYRDACWFQRLQETVDAIGALGKRVVVSEASYHWDPGGTVAAPMSGFPFTPQGQAAWVREHLRFANNHPWMEGFFYFYPEWKPGASADPSTVNLQTSGLFDAGEHALPALAEFSLPVGESGIDCLFRWAERRFPTLLAPAGAPTEVFPPYVFRYYAGTGAHVGVAGRDPRVYYLPPVAGATVQDLGPLAQWLREAGCDRNAAARTLGRWR